MRRRFKNSKLFKECMSSLALLPPRHFADFASQFLLEYSSQKAYHQLKSIKYFRSRAIGLNTSRDRISPAKIGEYPKIFPNFQNCTRCEKDLKDNKHNSLHLGRKYARIFVLRHYLFLVPHSFLCAMLSENCSPLGTENVRRQIS